MLQFPLHTECGISGHGEAGMAGGASSKGRIRLLKDNANRNKRDHQFSVHILIKGNSGVHHLAYGLCMHNTCIYLQIAYGQEPYPLSS